jgi:hypothetical protein
MHRVLSSSLGRANAPGCLSSLDHEISSILRLPLVVLAFEGHDNPQDISMGRNVILCAKQDRRTRARPSSGLFPCYHGGVCFRRAFRMPDAELITGDSLEALLLFAVTCHYMHLGKSPFSQSSGLVALIMSGAWPRPAAPWVRGEAVLGDACLGQPGREWVRRGHHGSPSRAMNPGRVYSAAPGS